MEWEELSEVGGAVGSGRSCGEWEELWGVGGAEEEVQIESLSPRFIRNRRVLVGLRSLNRMFGCFTHVKHSGSLCDQCSHFTNYRYDRDIVTSGTDWERGGDHHV